MLKIKANNLSWPKKKEKKKKKKTEKNTAFIKPLTSKLAKRKKEKRSKEKSRLTLKCL